MMQASDYLDDLFSYINQAPTPYHAVAASVKILSDRGFQRLRNDDCWETLGPGSYYVTRNDAGLIAFTLSHNPQTGMPLRMAGAHTDSPGLKLKPSPAQLCHGCVQLGVEVYGGALLAPWFDRNLSIAGRVSWSRNNGPLQSSLIDFKRAVATIPSLCIHFDRDVNTTRCIDKQTALVPLVMLSDDPSAPDFHALLADELARRDPSSAGAAILAFDLFLYDTQPLCRVGLNSEFITGSRLDNLLSCHALVQAMVQNEARQNRLIILNDHEEVGSVSTAGAEGPFLKSVVERLFPDPALRQRAVGNSLLSLWTTPMRCIPILPASMTRITCPGSTRDRSSKPTPTSAMPPMPLPPPCSAGSALKPRCPASNSSCATIWPAVQPSAP
jgi:aspartyl aminopeptidase